ncbi:hypothetical protein LXL04_009565 [Taraxacum kok-saghyz]
MKRLREQAADLLLHTATSEIDFDTLTSDYGIRRPAPTSDYGIRRPAPSSFADFTPIWPVQQLRFHSDLACSTAPTSVSLRICSPTFDFTSNTVVVPCFGQGNNISSNRYILPQAGKFQTGSKVSIYIGKFKYIKMVKFQVPHKKLSQTSSNWVNPNHVNLQVESLKKRSGSMEFLLCAVRNYVLIATLSPHAFAEELRHAILEDYMEFIEEL